jgi:hypothetical protein
VTDNQILSLCNFSRPTTPQTVPTINTRRKQTSTIEQSPTVTKTNRRTTGGQEQPATTTATTTTAAPTPKRGRKSTKSATPVEPSPEKQSSTIDRPVRIALSSHLVNQNLNKFLLLLNKSFFFFRISIKIILILYVK